MSNKEPLFLKNSYFIFLFFFNRQNEVAQIFIKQKEAIKPPLGIAKCTSQKPKLHYPLYDMIIYAEGTL